MRRAKRGDPRTLGAYKKARAELRAQQHPYCWVCGNPIDYTLRYPNRWSFSSDHGLEQDAGGDHTDLRAAHLTCNLSRGATYGNHKRGRGAPPPTRPSREW